MLATEAPARRRCHLGPLEKLGRAQHQRLAVTVTRQLYPETRAMPADPGGSERLVGCWPEVEEYSLYSRMQPPATPCSRRCEETVRASSGGR